MLLVCALVAAPVRALALDAASTTTTVTLTPAAPAVGATATATVTVSGSASPTGTVTLTGNGATWGPVDLSGGTASVVVGPFPVGTTTLTATYAGDDANAASTGSVAVTVTAPVAAPVVTPAVPVPTAAPKLPPVPKVALTASAGQVSVGDAVTLRWRTTGADQVTAAGAWKGRRDPQGSVTVHVPTRGKSVFRLTAANAAGKQSARVVVMAARKAKVLMLSAPDDLFLPGAKVPVTASGLAVGEGWTLRLAGTVLATGKASKTGTVAQGVVVPRTVPEGVLALSITGSNPDRTGSADLSVIKPKPLPVQVETDSLPKKATQTVSVTGLLPSEPVTVSYQGKAIAQGMADAKGHFMLTFDVGTQKGEQSVAVVGGAPSRTGTASFTVTAKDRPATSDPIDPIDPTTPSIG